MEVTEVNNGLPATWGSSDLTFDKSDLVVPRLALVQAMSEAAQEGWAQPGAWVNSLDKTVIAKKTEPVEMIVIGNFKTVQTYMDAEYVKTEPWNSDLANLPYKEELNGKVIQRTHVMSYYVILPRDVKEMNTFPLVLSFKKTSYYEGKKLATMLMKQSMLKQPTDSVVFNLKSKEVQNDLGKFWVMDVSFGRKATEQEMTDARLWADITKTRRVNVETEEKE